MNDREHRIRERAHAMWLEEGQPEGEHARHWDAACREIDAQAAASTDSEVTPAPKKARTSRSTAPKTTPAAQAATAGEGVAAVAEAPKAKRAAAPKKAASTPVKRKSGSAKA